MANPIVPQGTLNRALTSVQVVDIPELNVTTGYFGMKVARITFEGDTADYLGTLAGAVASPRLYQIVTVQMYLNKSQPLSNQWENQRGVNAAIGDVVVVTDATTLGQYYLSNCILQNVPDLELSGDNNDYPVILKGTYYINSDLFQ